MEFMFSFARATGCIFGAFELDDKKSPDNRRMRMANWLDMNIVAFNMEHLANPLGQWMFSIVWR